MGQLVRSESNITWSTKLDLMLSQVFQTYYEENTLKNHSASDIAWIGSIQYGLIFTPVCILLDH